MVLFGVFIWCPCIYPVLLSHAQGSCYYPAFILLQKPCKSLSNQLTSQQNNDLVVKIYTLWLVLLQYFFFQNCSQSLTIFLLPHNMSNRLYAVFDVGLCWLFLKYSSIIAWGTKTIHIIRQYICRLYSAQNSQQL